MAASTRAPAERAARPVLLLDVMDTVVRDPFYTHMPAFFDLTFDQLLAAKHPSAWAEFERGELSETEFYAKFFSDGRPVDGDALKQHMAEQFRYVDGMPALLTELRQQGVEMHLMSNYPCWYREIERRLQVSQYAPWTFVSCDGHMKGLRKPSTETFAVAARVLQRQPSELILVDDRRANVEGARAAGCKALLFDGTEPLRTRLREMGLLPA